MSALAPPAYHQPCCGRVTRVPPRRGYPCYACALAATPYDDPIAVAYRERVARRSEATLAAVREAETECHAEERADG